MIRQINSFVFGSEVMKCGDLLVKDRILLDVDYQQALISILSEFNKELPLLNPRQAKVFYEYLIEKELHDKLDKESKIRSKKIDQKGRKVNNEYIRTVNITAFAKNTGQSFDAVLNMPYKDYLIALYNMDVIHGVDEDDGPDKEAFREIDKIHNKKKTP